MSAELQGETAAWWRGRRFLYLSGTGARTRRYRCDYAAEALRSLGADIAVAEIESTDLEQALDDYVGFVLQRAPFESRLAEFIEAARDRGLPTIYETDDLVFDPDFADQVAWPPEQTVDERRAAFERQQETLRACTCATVSTSPLATQARRFNPRVAVLPNLIGAELVDEADAISGVGAQHDDTTTWISYLSGTPTHDGDFLVATPALVSMLEQFSELGLLVVGYLTLDERLEAFGPRVKNLAFQPRERLHGLLNLSAINLAPLRATTFNASKSCLKYLEAALVGTPTIASAVDDFGRVIHHGANGLLARTGDEWVEALAALVRDDSLRRQLGAAAFDDVRLRHTTAAGAVAHGQVLRRLLEVAGVDSARGGAVRARRLRKPATGPPGDMDIEENTATTPAPDPKTVSAESTRWSDQLELLETQRKHAEAAVGGLRRQLELTRHEVDALRTELATTELLLGEREDELLSLRDKNRELTQYLKAMHHTLSWRLTRPLRAVRRQWPRHVVFTAREPVSSSAAVLFVSGAPEVARRYRCDHQAEQLKVLGATAEVASFDLVDLAESLDRFQAFVLHRVPWGSDVGAFLDGARAAGKPVLFDTDDLVFDPAVLDHVAALEDMPSDEVRLYAEGLERYRRSLQECDAVIVSTSTLKGLAGELHPRVVVSPNVASRAMVEAGDVARTAVTKRTDVVTIGYLSGTNTHKKDFAAAADALITVLDERPATRLLIAGPLIIDQRFERFGDRVQRVDTQAWKRLASLQAAIDINLAPLEGDNPFTASKSCVKWIEAALVGVPTVASPRPDFERVIRDGVNGFLADDTSAWREKLTALVDDPTLRRELGDRARADVLSEHTTLARADSFYSAFSQLLPAPAGNPLAINWIMRAPIAQNSGGYRNIFRIATLLGEKGHRQRLYVESIAHLSGLSAREIEAFIERAFGIPVGAEVVVGHEQIAAADVSIATHWPTAETVVAHTESLFKAYFIQDFEPEFYEESDPQYGAAERSYRLPLRHICLGAHLAQRLQDFTGVPSDLVDFALDPCFTTTTTPEKRGDPVRVLFFARPSLRRRGYDIGLEALRRIKLRRPDTEIVFFGTKTNELGDVPFELHEPRRPRCARRRGCDELMPHPADVLADEHLERPIRGDGVQLRRRRCRPSERDGDGRAGAKLPRRRVRAGFARRCRDDLDRRSRPARTPRTAGCERRSPQDVATHGRHVGGGVAARVLRPHG